MKDKKSVLVIGSQGHKLADACMDWGADFYVGDYDVVVISLVDLTSHKIEEFKKGKPSYLEDIRRHITESQQNKGLEVYCLLEPITLADSIGKHVDQEERKKWNNYAWSPVIPLLEDVAEGKKINNKTSKLPPEYLKLIKGWSILWERPLNNTGYVDRKKVDNSRQIVTKITTQPLLENNIGRYLSAEVSWRVQSESAHNNYVYETLYSSKGSISFFPQVEDIAKGIDVILETVCEPIEETPPAWVSSISVGDEAKISQAIEEKNLEIEEKKVEIQALEEQKGELDEYKKLLYASGFVLEEIVEKSFKFLGIEITSPAVKNKEDRLFIKEDASIPIEIRGKNSGLNEKDLNQLTSRFVDKPESKVFTTRGLFVLNHFRDIRPDKREEPFHFNIVEKAKPWQACLISTQTIFDLVKAKLEGKEYDELDKILFNTIGIFNLSNNDKGSEIIPQVIPE